VFDIGFFELFLIAIIGLFVIGPERLPSAIRTVALWFGRIRYTLRETRTEFEKHIGADDIRRELHNEQVMRSLEALKKTKEELAKTIEEDAQKSILPKDKDDELDDLPDSYPHDEQGRAVKTPGTAKAPGESSEQQPPEQQKTESQVQEGAESQASTESSSREPETKPAPKSSSVESQLSPETEAYLAEQSAAQPPSANVTEPKKQQHEQ